VVQGLGLHQITRMLCWHQPSCW